MPRVYTWMRRSDSVHGGIWRFIGVVRVAPLRGIARWVISLWVTIQLVVSIWMMVQWVPPLDSNGGRLLGGQLAEQLQALAMDSNILLF